MPLRCRSRICFAACGMLMMMVQPPAMAASPFEDLQIVELTHTLDGNFPFIPVPGVTFPFALAPIATIDANGVAANRWIIHEHLGTQIDAPNHFSKNGASLDALEAVDLIVPMVVIDFRERATRDVDASLEIADVQAWEARHGRIPERAAVMLYTGWDARIKDPEAYVNADENHVKHYPGFGVEAANWLIQNRNIWGVGVDTLSFDPGKDNEYKTHKAVLGAGKWAVEAVANLQSVPPSGATLFVGAPKVRGATGGPVRLIALRPRSPAFNAEPLHGVWNNSTPERVVRADGVAVYLSKRFTFDQKTWRIEFSVSEDPESKSKVFSGDFTGPYFIDDYLPLVQAYRGRFLFSSRTVTAYQPELIRALNAANCSTGKWIAGKSKDVNETGCPILRIYPRASCEGEYDLINVIGDNLYLGTRPADGNLCTEERRPHRLSATGLRKESE
jgi:kynurenine formamidase